MYIHKTNPARDQLGIEHIMLNMIGPTHPKNWIRFCYNIGRGMTGEYWTYTKINPQQ